MGSRPPKDQWSLWSITSACWKGADHNESLAGAVWRCGRSRDFLVYTMSLVFRLLRSRLLASRLSARVLGWVFTYMPFVIPVERLRETDTLIAFYHPRPSYPIHILIVAKRSYSSLMTLPDSDTLFMSDLFGAVQSLTHELRLDERGFRLICNGGAYQDIPHLHFQLISGDF